MSLTEHDNSFSRSKSRPPPLALSVISTALAFSSLLSNLPTALIVGSYLYLLCRPAANLADHADDFLFHCQIVLEVVLSGASCFYLNLTQYPLLFPPYSVHGFLRCFEHCVHPRFTLIHFCRQSDYPRHDSCLKLSSLDIETEVEILLYFLFYPRPCPLGQFLVSCLTGLTGSRRRPRLLHSLSCRRSIYLTCTLLSQYVRTRGSR